MTTVKKYSRQFPIREYLYRRVVKTGSEPEQLPSERKLAQDFGVARETVRRVIAELEASNNCIRIPGKKALFTNPAHSNPDVHFIGVLAHYGKGAELSHYAQSILSRIHLKIEHLTPFYQILTLPEHFTPEEKAGYIYKQKHDALLWLLPEEEDTDTLSILYNEHAPLTTVATLSSYKENRIYTKNQSIICPNDNLQYQEFTQLCKNNTYTNPLFLLSRKWQEDELAEAFKQAGLSIPVFYNTIHENSTEDKLIEILKKEKFDAIFFCLGDSEVISALSHIKDDKKLSAKPILMQHGITQKTALQKLDLNISFLDEKSYYEILDDLSLRAAEQIKNHIGEVQIVEK